MSELRIRADEPGPSQESVVTYTSATMDVLIQSSTVLRKEPTIRVIPISMLTATARAAAAMDVVDNRSARLLRLNRKPKRCGWALRLRLCTRAGMKRGIEINKAIPRMNPDGFQLRPTAATQTEARTSTPAPAHRSGRAAGVVCS